MPRVAQLSPSERRELNIAKRREDLVTNGRVVPSVSPKDEFVKAATKAVGLSRQVTRSINDYLNGEIDQENDLMASLQVAHRKLAEGLAALNEAYENLG